jgi:hypothetical protein
MQFACLFAQQQLACMIRDFRKPVDRCLHCAVPTSQHREQSRSLAEPCAPNERTESSLIAHPWRASLVDAQHGRVKKARSCESLRPHSYVTELS